MHDRRRLLETKLFPATVIIKIEIFLGSENPTARSQKFRGVERILWWVLKYQRCDLIHTAVLDQVGGVAFGIGIAGGTVQLQPQVTLRRQICISDRITKSAVGHHQGCKFGSIECNN